MIYMESYSEIQKIYEFMKKVKYVSATEQKDHVEGGTGSACYKIIY